jgi:hypothetical protein
MKKPINLIFYVFILLNLMNCKIPQKSKTPNINNQNITDEYFCVSFISIGEGTDQQAKEKLNVFLEEFEKKNPKSISLEKKKWGREGEIDYCITFIKYKKQDEFKNEIKDLLKDSKLVRYK